MDSTPDLFAIIEVVDEHTLGKRLIQQGVDLYIEGEFASFAERLREVIVRAQAASVICGRDSGGKVENYAAAFARVTGETLVKKVPRGTRNTQQHQQGNTTS